MDLELPIMCYMVYNWKHMNRKNYSQNFKKKARTLRSVDGLSYGEIARKLKISKSTVKSWCYDIVLSPAHHARLYTKQVEILSRGPKSSHERRMKEIEKIIQDGEREIITPLDINGYKLIGAALYWAEGDKTKNFAVANSDPLMIKFLVQWMDKVLGVPAQRIKAHLNIYSQQNESEIKLFWSDLTGIPIENFGKSFVKPANKNYKKNTLYYGTIKIRCFRGTDLRHRVFGWVKAFLKEIGPSVEEVERKWYKLKTDYKRR